MCESPGTHATKSVACHGQEDKGVHERLKKHSVVLLRKPPATVAARSVQRAIVPNL